MNMTPQKLWLPLATAVGLALVGALRLTLAQSADPAAKKAVMPTAADKPMVATDASAAGSESLPAQQAKLAAKYKDLERALLRMAEVVRTTDPKRAALLQR